MTPAEIEVHDVVDAHHHIWRRADLPWLNGPMIPRIFGPYEPLRRDYPADEYIRDATSAGVAAAVYVQPNWALDRVVDEVEWIQGVHAAHGWPHAVVGSADMFDRGAPAVFAAQRDRSPLMRGTRLQLHWHPDERFRFASAPDRMNDPIFRENVGALGDLGWLFELQVFPPQMADAARLVADFPDVTFVLIHAGMLEHADPVHVAAWEEGLRLLAAHPNVMVKLSGQGTFLHRVDAGFIRMVAGTVLDLFGADRCMWGSNFPIEGLWTDYRTLAETWMQALSDVPVPDRRNVLGATARRVYGLPNP